ncbi:MAG TPA: alpha/beta fold hydrolase [Longimicrobiales bacterium]
MLEYEVRVPAQTDARTPLLILLHGRGSNRHDLFSLAPHMPDNMIVVAPEAPFSAAPWGYGPGSAWYQFLGGNRPEPNSFRKSLQALEEFLGELARTMTFGPVIIGGFSQGGTIGIAYGLTHSDQVAGVLNFSGFLADHPDVNAVIDAASAPSPRPGIFWGHGRQDPAIPFARAVDGRARLKAAGYDVTAHDYDIGHWIDAEELGEAVAWLERITR